MKEGVAACQISLEREPIYHFHNGAKYNTRLYISLKHQNCTHLLCKSTLGSAPSQLHDTFGNQHELIDPFAWRKQIQEPFTTQILYIKKKVINTGKRTSIECLLCAYFHCIRLYIFLHSLLHMSDEGLIDHEEQVREKTPK